MTDETENKNLGGRPKGSNKYSPELRDKICARLAAGESLRSICRDEDMPDRSTIHRWLYENIGEELDGDQVKVEGFYDHYARARDVGLDEMADEIIEIGDNRAGDTYEDKDGNTQVDHAIIQRDRLRSDNRKWYLSKLAPKRYGNERTIRHQQLDGDGEPTDPAAPDVNNYAKDIADAVHAEMEKTLKKKEEKKDE